MATLAAATAASAAVTAASQRALPVEVTRALPPEIAAPLAQARWIGGGRLTVFGFDAYDAALWAPQGFRSADFMASSFVLELTYLRSFKARAIAERSLHEMARFAPLSDDRRAAWLAELQAVLPDVQPGDRIAGCACPGRGAFFVANGRLRGEVGDTEFARLFFSIWLAAASSEPQLRDTLLGRAS